jgi:hypothetical protein
MRIGQNPSKMRGSPAYTPKRVGLASLTYVPDLQGYFREAREVIDVHLASLRASLDQECDLCVFDNGSCPQVLDFLQDRWRNGMIDWLCLSHHNLGKNGALNWIFSAMPNEFIGYSDSDVFFRKGWLAATLQIFESFEDAGMVSAQPIFFDFLRGQGKTSQSIAAREPKLSIQLMQLRQEIVDEYCDGINASAEIRAEFQQAQLQVAVNHQTGVQAVTSATDMQFMLPKRVARQLTPLPIAGALTAKDAIDIPRGIEALEYWILSSKEPLVRHMGNTLRGSDKNHPLEIPEISAVLEHINSESQFRKPAYQQTKKPTNQKTNELTRKEQSRLFLQRWLDRSPGLRRSATRLYDNLFSLLYEERKQ